jgi:kinetochore protein Mis12/MTW1
LQGLNLVSSLDAPTIESINLQRRKYQENQRLQRHLQAETSRNAALIENLKSLRGSLTNETVPKVEPTESDAPPTYPAFAFLDKKGDLAAGSALAPLSTTTAFALSQLPALKALLAELRPQMKKLAEKEKNDPNLVQNESAKTFRRQRLEYIEIQTRKHLENVQGRELGKHGEVVDGEWQGEGRKLTRGEVEDLERVVAMVGGRSEDEMDQS